VAREAEALARVHPELVITGIHIGHYGRDLTPSWTLARLVAHLLDRVSAVRFRLGSIEATEVDADLVRLLETSGGRLAPHLHMPLQSGSDPILRGMRRWHTREQYRRHAWEIVERVGEMGLGADIITGFPGETDVHHAETRSLVEELPFTYLHVFPFSPREGTAATGLPARVPQRVAGERSRELRMLAQEKGRSYRLRRVGGSAHVVLEGRGGTALTGDYLRVEVPVPPRAPRGLLGGVLRARGEHLYIAWPPQSPTN
jgi:threonylcarbamoyladenosine tRNA methylthiotransferase MtaB